MLRCARLLQGTPLLHGARNSSARGAFNIRYSRFTVAGSSASSHCSAYSTGSDASSSNPPVTGASSQTDAAGQSPANHYAAAASASPRAPKELLEHDGPDAYALRSVRVLPEYPSSWLSDAEVKEYLWPLYARGWYISKEPRLDGTRRESHTLRKSFKFKRRIWATAFVKEVMDTMLRCQHDAVLQLDVYKVQAEMQTHTAYAPFGDEKKCSHPGITFHDINLAVELEKIWQESCENNRVSGVHMRAGRHVGADGENAHLVTSLVKDALENGYLVDNLQEA